MFVVQTGSGGPPPQPPLQRVPQTLFSCVEWPERKPAYINVVWSRLYRALLLPVLLHTSSKVLVHRDVLIIID